MAWNDFQDGIIIGISSGNDPPILLQLDSLSNVKDNPRIKTSDLVAGFGLIRNEDRDIIMENRWVSSELIFI